MIRRDIPQPHLTVQAAHAAIAATFAFGEPNQPHPNLVICTVADERELEDLFENIKASGVPCCAWREDDMGMALTAIASGPLRGDERQPMRGLKLLR